MLRDQSYCGTKIALSDKGYDYQQGERQTYIELYPDPAIEEECQNVEFITNQDEQCHYILHPPGRPCQLCGLTGDEVLTCESMINE